MRKFIRHPLDVPIEYQLLNSETSIRDRLKDISGGGLCFRVQERIEPAALIRISIGIDPRRFSASAHVIWCREANGYYDIGVKFTDDAAEYGMRMAEQVYHIQQYKTEMLQRHGRRLTDKEAADEWIAKFAERFPA